MKKKQKVRAKDLIQKLEGLGDPHIAEHSQRFFKTGKGEYGEGDVFLGIRVPVVRKQIKLFREMELDEVQVLLQSEFHEVRLSALLLLVEKFKKSGQEEQQAIFRFYLNNTRYVNNWDLVDSSACIVGAYLTDRDRTILSDLVRSESLWERRIAIIATFHFIKNAEYVETLKLADYLLNDREDLVHKAVGWMLREVGKRDIGIEKEFLAPRYKKMPRTMLRYAIEKFPEQERKMYLRGEI